MVFASFLTLAYFMIHNIILSRIFQIYSTKLKQSAIKRCAAARHASVNKLVNRITLTIPALPSHAQPPPLNRNAQRQEALCQAFDALDEGKTGRLPRGLVAHVLHRLKPHYSETKLQVWCRCSFRPCVDVDLDADPRTRHAHPTPIQTIMFHASKDNPDDEDTRDYDVDQFTTLMISVVDDRLHRIRPAIAHSCA